jgi:peroxiredoxin
VTPVQVRKRLLFGSLAVAAVVSVAVGWAIAQNGNSNDGAGAGDRPANTFETPNIEINDDNEGDPLPHVTVQNLAGDDVQLASLVGTPMVINVWFSSCGPCKQELPAFAAAHDTYGDQVQFIGLDSLPPSDREEQFARDRGVQYDLLYDGNGEFIIAAGVASFPYTLFVSADGTIVHQTGQLSQQELEGLIERYLL